jgi:hypothetical protein
MAHGDKEKTCREKTPAGVAGEKVAEGDKEIKGTAAAGVADRATEVGTVEAMEVMAAPGTATTRVMTA